MNYLVLNFTEFFLLLLQSGSQICNFSLQPIDLLPQLIRIFNMIKWLLRIRIICITNRLKIQATNICICTGLLAYRTIPLLQIGTVFKPLLKAMVFNKYIVLS